jgi:peroxiredoxin
MADTEAKGAKAFDVLSPQGYANRVTFVIDKKGVVRKIFDFKKDTLDLQKHPDEVLKYVKENLAEKK